MLGPRNSFSCSTPAEYVVRYSLAAIVACYTFLIIVEFCRGRSLWLDEAFIYHSLVSKNLPQLFGGPLVYGQQFPRVYLGLIYALPKIAGEDPLYLRLIPAFFGIAACVIWVKFFFEFFWIKQRKVLPCLLSAGLFLSNGYALYYACELKQYSAEMFFAGILFLLYTTSEFAEDRRYVLASIFCVASLLFSYSAVFVIIGLGFTMLFDGELLYLWKVHRRGLLLTALALMMTCSATYLLDLRFGENPTNGGVLHSYWATSFPQGSSFVMKLDSLFNLRVS